jgi:hypothetical protein
MNSIFHIPISYSLFILKSVHVTHVCDYNYCDAVFLFLNTTNGDIVGISTVKCLHGTCGTLSFQS